MLRVARVDEHVVHVAVHAVETADSAEALAAVLAEDQRAVGLEDTLGILRVDDQVGEVERAPHHPAGSCRRCSQVAPPSCEMNSAESVDSMKAYTVCGSLGA